VAGKTVTLKVKYSDFKQVTRSLTLDKPTNDGMNIYLTAKGLLKKTETGRRSVRLLGVSMSGLHDGDIKGQMSLFSTDEKTERSEKLNKAIDSLQDKFGARSVMPGRLVSEEETLDPEDL